VELKAGAKPYTREFMDALKNKFQLTWLLNPDEIELVSFGSLETSGHKGKKVLDLRKAKPISQNYTIQGGMNDNRCA
jgi:hypothetical protein